MSDQTYNGWTNWETWIIKLWIDSEQADYFTVARNAEHFEGLPDEFRTWFKDWIENRILNGLKSTEGNITMDLVLGSFKQANLDEIVDSYIEDFGQWLQEPEQLPSESEVRA